MDGSEHTPTAQEVVDTTIPADAQTEGTPAAPEETDEQKEAQRAEAKSKGWRDEKAFKGPPEKFESAGDYLDRWSRTMPLIQRENHNLSQKLTAAEQRALKAEERIAAIEKREAEREQARSEIQESSLQSEYARALEAGDSQAASRIHTEMVKLSVKSAIPREAPAPAADQEVDRVKTAMNEFFDSNPVFANEEMAALLGEEVAVARAANPRGSPALWLARGADRVQRIYPDKFTAPKRSPAMAEMGGRPSTATNGRSKTWSDLKPDVAVHLNHLIANEPSFKSMGLEKARASVLKQVEPDQFRN